MLLSVLFIVCGSVISFDFDPFERHIRRHLNHSIAPCDNFFLHVCPHNFNDEESIMRLTEKDMVSMSDFGSKLIQLPPISKFSYLIDKFISHFSPEERTMLHLMNTFYKGLFHRSAILPVILSNQEQFNFPLMKDVVARLNTSVFQGILDSRTHFGRPQWVHFVNWYKFQHINFPLEDEDIFDVNRYTTLIKMIGSDYERETGRFRFTEANILQRRNDFVHAVNRTLSPVMETFKLFSPNLFVRVKNALLWNAENSLKRYVTLQESILLPVAHRSVPLASVYGSLGYVVSHEMLHSYLKEDELGKDAQLDKNVECQEKHYARMCLLFKERPQCNSAHSTFAENAADLEGIQIAYKTMRTHLAGNLKAHPPTLPSLTQEQLFFYSAAITYCRSSDQEITNDRYSPTVVRINGMFSQMDAFQKAFGCRNTQHMVSIDKCNYFGEAV